MSLNILFLLMPVEQNCVYGKELCFVLTDEQKLFKVNTHPPNMVIQCGKINKSKRTYACK